MNALTKKYEREEHHRQVLGIVADGDDDADADGEGEKAGGENRIPPATKDLLAGEESKNLGQALGTSLDRIEALYLSDNNLGRDAAMILQIPTMAPKPLNGLLRLGLNGNNLGDEGVLWLLECILEVPNLKVLGLS